MTIVGRFLPIGKCCSSVEQGARLGINLETCRSQHALRPLLIGAALPISTAGEQSHPTQIVTVGHDRGRWQASRTLDICHLVKNATTLLETIMLNGTPR